VNEYISILDEITRGGYEASLITSYNAYLPFYEDVILRKLISRGVRHNILMMDSAQCAQAISLYPPRLAGRYYSLIPMSSAGAFHPKMILLVGKNRGALFVGSHNLTLSGFGYNRELTNLVRVQRRDDKEKIPILQKAWRNAHDWLENQKDEFPSHLVDMFLKLRDFAPWLKEYTNDTQKDEQILSTQSNISSLLDQLIEKVQGTVKQVIITGAFFDSELSLLKRIKSELKPKDLFVCIDPTTVQIPADKRMAGVTFVNGSILDAPNSEKVSSGYLHAKSLIVETFQKNFYLVIGSANPSEPAWLRPGLSGNTEMALLRIGAKAREVAKSLGLLNIPQLPQLSAIDWKIARQNWLAGQEKSKQTPPITMGICLATEKGIIIKIPKSRGLERIHCEVLNTNKIAIGKNTAHRDNEYYLLEFPLKQISKAGYLLCTINGKQKMLIVQHQRMIEEQSRTGTQQRFREALSSLTADTPDLETLIKCVDKIIFSKASEANQSVRDIKSSKNPNAQESKEPVEGQPLSVDISETKKTIKKYRLRRSDDLAYLLDVLIYHLSMESEHEMSSMLNKQDSKGRSEEEQIDADDESLDEDAIEEGLSQKTLDLCHRKVKTLVGRMSRQLNALQQNKVPFEDIIVRLTGVLAVLRQLRNCDGKVAWIKQGQTAFPLEDRKRLFDVIVNTLFEKPNSLLYPKNEEFTEVDELARLRGLVLWLAWDSGMQLRKKNPFLESTEEMQERVRSKALMLALAQLVRGDEVVIEEAKQSIGPLCTSDMDWLDWILSTNRSLEKYIQNPESLRMADNVSIGDWAVYRDPLELGARLVLRVEGNKVALAYFGRNKNYISYTKNVLRVGSYNEFVRH